MNTQSKVVPAVASANGLALPLSEKSGLLGAIRLSEADLELLKSVIVDALAKNATAIYICNRTWSAWNHGTMSQGDFVELSNSPEVLADMASSAFSALVNKSAELAVTAVFEGINSAFNAEVNMQKACRAWVTQRHAAIEASADPEQVITLPEAFAAGAQWQASQPAAPVLKCANCGNTSNFHLARSESGLKGGFAYICDECGALDTSASGKNLTTS